MSAEGQFRLQRGLRYKGYIKRSLGPYNQERIPSRPVIGAYDLRTNSLHYFPINSQHLNDRPSPTHHPPFNPSSRSVHFPMVLSRFLLFSIISFTCKSDTKFEVVLKCHRTFSSRRRHRLVSFPVSVNYNETNGCGSGASLSAHFLQPVWRR